MLTFKVADALYVNVSKAALDEFARSGAIPPDIGRAYNSARGQLLGSRCAAKYDAWERAFRRAFSAAMAKEPEAFRKSMLFGSNHKGKNTCSSS